PSGPAEDFPGPCPGTDQAGISPAGGNRRETGLLPAGPFNGNYLRHRHPGQRGGVHHGGGGKRRESGNLLKRKGPHYPFTPQALPEASAIRQKTENRFRRDFPHQKRQNLVAEADLGGNESPLPKSGGDPRESVP